jgi:anaerobic ribonucleoside-triphosphate reductase activating protein
MRYAQIRDMDISNGRGIGCSIFLQGCSMNPHCKNCFNQSTWDFNGGKEWTEKEEKKLFEILSRPHITRFTCLGGEPLDQAKDLSQLLYKIRDKFPDLKIWIYSGRTFEENIKDTYKKECLVLCDVLVDGRFIEEQKDLTLAFRGSRNQRIIDLNETFKTNKIVELDLDNK